MEWKNQDGGTGGIGSVVTMVENGDILVSIVKINQYYFNVIVFRNNSNKLPLLMINVQCLNYFPTFSLFNCRNFKQGLQSCIIFFLSVPSFNLVDKFRKQYVYVNVLVDVLIISVMMKVQCFNYISDDVGKMF